MPDTKKHKVVSINKKAVENEGNARKPLVETAYERIQEAVSNGTFLPGQRMLEAEIATWLDISRTPVREALRRLIDQDTLSYDRYGNLVVTKVDQQMVIEVYRMREVLEGAAARMAARHAYDEEIESIMDLVQAFSKEPESRREQFTLNMLFHQAVVNAAHNRYLSRAMDVLPFPVQARNNLLKSPPERLKKIEQEHREIATAIANHDPDGAEEAARFHVNVSRKRWLQRLKEEELKD